MISSERQIEKADVLVIDDDTHIRVALESYLSELGHTPASAPNGIVGLELLNDGKDAISVAIVDLHMPVMDGFAVVRAIHQFDPTIQCIILTGHGSLETAIEAVREQVYEYVTQSVSLNDLDRVVRRAAEYAQLLREKQAAVTALAHRSDELAASVEALKEAQARLIRTGNAALMGQLAEGLRHELGNALTVIRLNMNLLTHYRTDPEQFKRHMESMEQSMLDMERITLALRYLPSAEMEGSELLDLAELVTQATSEAEEALPTRDVSFSLELDRPAIVRGAAFQILRAFVGVIENSIEACSTANALPCQIKIALEEAETGWRITISDTGPGFTPEALAHATEPGFTTKIDRGFMRGLGLGLFVTQNVLELHGGWLKLTNRPEGGAAVIAWLPCAVAQPGERISPLLG